MNDLQAAAPFLLLACLFMYALVKPAGHVIGRNIDDSPRQQGCGMILLTVLALPAFILLLVGLVAGLLAALP